MATNLTLTARELAAALHVTPRTLHTLVVTGQIPMPVRVGQRRILWRVADVEQFLKDGGTPALKKSKPGRPRKKSGGAS